MSCWYTRGATLPAASDMSSTADCCALRLSTSSWKSPANGSSSGEHFSFTYARRSRTRAGFKLSGTESDASAPAELPGAPTSSAASIGVESFGNDSLDLVRPLLMASVRGPVSAANSCCPKRSEFACQKFGGPKHVKRTLQTVLSTCWELRKFMAYEVRIASLFSVPRLPFSLTWRSPLNDH
jgi:hypothetical protein